MLRAQTLAATQILLFWEHLVPAFYQVQHVLSAATVGASFLKDILMYKVNGWQ